MLQLLSNLAGALDATHAAGGVHRDVKGDNILVRHDLIPRMLSLSPEEHGTAVVINGGCWFDVNADPADCEDDGGYVYKERCYLPALPRRRQPTSTPQDSR